MVAEHGGQKNRNGKTIAVLFLPCFLLVNTLEELWPHYITWRCVGTAFGHFLSFGLFITSWSQLVASIKRHCPQYMYENLIGMTRCHQISFAIATTWKKFSRVAENYNIECFTDLFVIRDGHYGARIQNHTCSKKSWEPHEWFGWANDRGEPAVSYRWTG